MGEVILKHEKIASLLGLRNLEDDKEYQLTIPSYQRIYCWEEENVLQLLDDISQYSHLPYHLGSIILHQKENNVEYDVVDGQQRLVTLALILMSVDKEISLDFLDEVFESEEARSYIAYNKYIISHYVETHGLDSCFVKQILDNLQCSVILIKEASLDLAYTFFSNENSRGKALSDYSLLKAHHLRFINIDGQAENVAKRWDAILLSSENDESSTIMHRLFDKYLFRLRKWTRKREWDENTPYKIKTEFSAAPFIDDIPAYSGQFGYNDSLLGGTYFFDYTNYFIIKLNTFSSTKEYQVLQKYLSGEYHWWYKDIVEAFLFAYYIKFENIYLSLALSGILALISEHRYDNFRTNLRTLLRHANDTEIIMMINQATSPSFFLAELRVVNKMNLKQFDFTGTRKRYSKAVEEIERELKEK